jgi:hypothetical protein
MKQLLSLLTLAALVVAASSCAAPVQNGGVIVSPHAAARLDIMCRYRANDPQQLCIETTDE